MTVIVNLICLVTLTADWLTSLTMTRSTIGAIVTLSIVSLLFDRSVSSSVLFTLTKLESVPFEMTLA